MTQHSHTNPTLHDMEKDEGHESHELNTAQFGKVLTEQVRTRAQEHAKKLADHNAANSKGFPEDD